MNVLKIAYDEKKVGELVDVGIVVRNRERKRSLKPLLELKHMH